MFVEQTTNYQTNKNEGFVRNTNDINYISIIVLYG